MKSFLPFSAFILVVLLATPSNGQDLDASKVQILQQSVLTIRSFDADGKLIREGGGFFINAAGDVITSRQIMRDAARVEIRNSVDAVYPSPIVTGVDEATGILRLTTSNLQSKVSFLSIASNELKDKQTALVLNHKGAVKLTEGTDFLKTQIPTLGQLYKVTTAIPLASTGDPVVNSAGELIGVLVIETLGGRVQTFIVSNKRVLSVKTENANKPSLAEWNTKNNLEWLFTGPGLYYKGIVLQTTEGCAQALSVFESALEEDRNNANTWFFAGRCKSEIGDPQAAIEYQRQALRLNPKLDEAYIELGAAYVDAFEVFGGETYSTASDSFRKSIATRRNNADIYAQLLTSLQDNNQRGGFIGSFTPYFGFDPFGRNKNSVLGHTFAIAQYGVEPIYNSDNTILLSTHPELGQYENTWSTGHSGVCLVVSGSLRCGLPSEEYLGFPIFNKLPGPDVTKSYTVSGVYPITDQPEMTVNNHQGVPRFNPFLTQTESGDKNFLLGHDYLGGSSYQNPIDLNPRTPLAHLYPQTSFLGASKSQPSTTSFQNTIKLPPPLTFATNSSAFENWSFVRPYTRDKRNEIWSGVIRYNFETGNVSSIMELPERSFRIMGVAPAQFIGPTYSYTFETEPSNLIDYLPLNATLRNSSIPPVQESPETLFSASWFTQEQSSENTNDITAAKSYLEVGNRYLLKVALQDIPFPTIASGTISGQTSAPQSQLTPGTEMEISYFSEGLDPQHGTSRLLSPHKGAISVSSFPVKATHSDVRGKPVWIEIRLKGLIIYNGTLTIPIVPPTGGVVERQLDAAPEPQPTNRNGVVLAGSPSVDPKASRRYEKLRDYDVEITITQQGTGPFYVELDWKGVDSKTKPSGLTPTGLNELLNGVRADLKEQLAAKALGGHTKEGSDEREIDALTMDRNVRQQLLFQLANLGHRLYDSLFKDPEHRTLLRRIKEYAQAHPETVLRIQIKNKRSGEALNRMLLPFGLLYDAPNFNENSLLEDVNAKNFWDSRFQIELNETSSYKKWSLCEDGPIRVVAVMDTGGMAEGTSTAEEWRREVREQQKYLTELTKTQRITLKFAKNEEEFLNIFKGDPSPLDLIYYYGHTSTSPKPSFSITNGSRSVFQIRDAATDTNNQLRLLQKHPFVFLNSCKGAAFAGDSQDTFLNLMNDLGASGFIGTETTVRIPYAARIGREFFKKIISYKSDVPLVQVLREMKHEALSSNDGNPLIMLYSIYADPSLRTCSYK